MILPEENLLNTTVYTPRNDTVTQFNEGNGFNKGSWHQFTNWDSFFTRSRSNVSELLDELKK